MKKICFNELDNWVKLAIITGWVTAFVWVVVFLVEFVDIIIYGV